MTLRRFAFNNVLRNSRIYAAYFLSSAFSVMVFFVYSMFAFHPGLNGETIQSDVSMAMHFAEAIIYAFSFFFVLYSMGAFLKTRKKEFGVLVMHGMSNMQLRGLVFMENMIIGFAATVTGIGIGLVFAKLILLVAQNALRLDQTLTFYFPASALGLTFGAFMVLFFAISLFTVAILRGHKLIDLLKGSTKPKPAPMASAFLSWAAVLLLAGGYAAALSVKGTLVVYAMIPVTLVVIVGTYFLFTQLSVYLINRSRGNRAFFWRRTNLVLFSDLAYRMKDNARTFFMVAILSTVAFSAIGSLIGFKSMYTNIVKDENPFAIEYMSSAGNPSELSARHLDLIDGALAESGADYLKYEADIKYAKLESGQTAAVVKASEFNSIAKAAGEKLAEVRGNEAAVVYYNNSLYKKSADLSDVALADSKVSLHPVQAIQSVSLRIFGDYYVVPDPLYEQLGSGEKVDRFHAFDVRHGSADLVEIGERLEKELNQDGANGRFDFFSLDYQLFLLDQAYGMILFVGLFIGIVFFVGAGSFLYFRLYTDLEEDKRKFQAIRKLGLSDREMSRVLTKQILLLFFVPILVAVVHGAVALTALQHLFDYGLLRESSLVLGAFVLIQIVYYLLIRTSYIANVKRA
ncbi:FtsX-like permease family protein [Cohnella thailandensis]|uniref:ABC transporter permease n=1 Tax=Cohnella thailandensis TaxID=557557 RepID=A0A841T4S6_9BACL|nr:ABC transporter permease [Cohnella thailandensis]MBB6637655.1 ABC transporter permease [Cohnella thailandensis]MBP1974168.1 putative ABC transport system permease protein [Cohnella thailandensis]